jgi:hypothetical protein
MHEHEQNAEERPMLHSLKDLERYSVRVTDGAIGTVSTFLHDDERWAVRYMVLKIQLGSRATPRS